MNKDIRLRRACGRHILMQLIFLMYGLSSSLLYATAMTFYVSNNGDSGTGTLRAAITGSNLNDPSPDPYNTISFAGFNGIISPLTDEPMITEPVLIDGYTAVGASANTNPITLANNAVITVQLDGPGPVYNPSAPLMNGLFFGPGSAGSIVRGLAITDWAAVQGIDVNGNPISGNGIVLDDNTILVSGNFIGMNLLNQSAPNFTAVWINSGTSGNSIGDGTPAGRNLISGQYGDFGTIRNNGNATVIMGNTIGLDRTGTIALMSDARLGLVNQNETGAVIGGTASLNQRNVIAGFSGANVVLRSAPNTTVQSNFIGVNIGGTAAVTPNGVGVFIDPILNGQPDNIIVNGNTISGNGYGVMVGENNANLFPAVGVSVTSNFIGTDSTGSFAVPNTLDGVWVKFGFATYIAGNTISGNGRHGIRLDKSKLSNIKSNFIGTNLAGIGLGNGGDGIRLGGQGVGIHSFGDIIGGAKASDGYFLSDGNNIQYNGGNGITSQGFVQNGTIQGNTISGNSGAGIVLNPGASNMNIGGFQDAGNLRIIGGLSSQGNTALGLLGTSNTISNTTDGITFNKANNNVIQANLISGNGGNGVDLIDSSFNLVGAPDAGNSAIPQVLGNTITNNGGAGVAVVQATCNATDNSIVSNMIDGNTSNGIVLITE